VAARSAEELKPAPHNERLIANERQAFIQSGVFTK
jgi:hypothetical protein